MIRSLIIISETTNALAINLLKSLQLPQSRLNGLRLRKELLLCVPVVNVPQSNLTAFAHDIVLVFFEMLDDVLIIDHFADGD